MSATKRDQPTPGCLPALPSLEANKHSISARKPAIRLALSARGPRKEQHGHSTPNDHHRGAQTERQLDKESSHIETFYKTRYCRYFTQQGNCWKGSDCQFAHSEEELRTPPDLTKTRMCAMYRLGCCKLSSDECSFAHSLGDLKATDNFYKTEICSFWANGFCRAGDACRHAHGEEEIRPRVTRLKPRIETKSSSTSASSSSVPQSEDIVSDQSLSANKPLKQKVSLEGSTSSTSPSSASPLGHPSPSHSSSSSPRGQRDKMLSSASTCFTSVNSTASLSLSKASNEQSHPSAAVAEESVPPMGVRISSSKLSKRFSPPRKSQSSSSGGASTPETCSEDFTASSTKSQTPRMTPTVFVPSPVPCFVPAAPWMYMQAVPTSRQLVGIPLNDALNDIGLDREGFCLGVPSYSSHVVAMGFLVGHATPPTFPSTACASWAYPAPYGLTAFDSHIVY